MEGRQVRKWGRRGWPHKTRLHVEDHHLIWNHRPSASPTTSDERRIRREKDARFVALKGVRALVPGVDRRDRPKVTITTSVLCFTVVGKERVLELECGTVKERDEWMEGLIEEVAAAKTEGCRWSGRVMMSIDKDPKVEWSIAPGDEAISFI
jgi:hypothetical protein